MEGNGKGKSGEQTGQSVAAAAGGCSGAAAGLRRGRAPFAWLAGAPQVPVLTFPDCLHPGNGAASRWE